MKNIKVKAIDALSKKALYQKITAIQKEIYGYRAKLKKGGGFPDHKTRPLYNDRMKKLFGHRTFINCRPLSDKILSGIFNELKDLNESGLVKRAKATVFSCHGLSLRNTYFEFWQNEDIFHLKLNTQDDSEPIDAGQIADIFVGILGMEPFCRYDYSSGFLRQCWCHDWTTSYYQLEDHRFYFAALRKKHPSIRNLKRINVPIWDNELSKRRSAYNSLVLKRIEQLQIKEENLFIYLRKCLKKGKKYKKSRGMQIF